MAQSGMLYLRYAIIFTCDCNKFRGRIEPALNLATRRKKTRPRPHPAPPARRAPFLWRLALHPLHHALTTQWGLLVGAAVPFLSHSFGGLPRAYAGARCPFSRVHISGCASSPRRPRSGDSGRGVPIPFWLARPCPSPDCKTVPSSTGAKRLGYKLTAKEPRGAAGRSRCALGPQV